MQIIVMALHKAGHHDKEKEICDIGLGINPENINCILQQTICYISQGDSLAGDKNIKRLRSWAQENNWSESQIARGRGNLLMDAEDTIEAEKYYRKAYDLDDTDLWNIFNLAKVLINADININEGMELAEKALLLIRKAGC